ncbi:MAG: GNAT family N-acetyltransferase [Alphaproteobacteria bacterium]|nr:GNAT family N-acetyltransferase [Alphaproteobacteria bacterium]MBO6864931.1 GNAT family N-acetyltransferase [Alphaproteobacteria bacterium]
MITLKRATGADAHRLTDLYVDFYAEDAIDVPRERVAENVAFMAEDDRAAIWIAERNGEPVGMSSATITFGVEFGWACELEDLYIRPDHRGQGLSRRLLGAAIDWARDRKVTQVILVITPEAEAEQGLSAYYRKLGFQDSGRVTMYLDV